MTALLVDTSVLIKWFHSDGESELDEARAIRRAVQRGDLQALAIPLVSADTRLLGAGLAESPTAFARRLGL